MEGKAYNRLVLDAVGLAPGGHDEGVVVGDDDDLVDALSLEVVELGLVARDVVGLAGRGESAGDGDENDLLVLELYINTRGVSPCRKRITHLPATERQGGGIIAANNKTQ